MWSQVHCIICVWFSNYREWVFTGQTRVLSKCLAWNFGIIYIYVLRMIYSYVLRMIYSYGVNYCGEKCVWEIIYFWRRYLSWGIDILEIICTYLVLEDKNTWYRSEPEISQTFWKIYENLGLRSRLLWALELRFYLLLRWEPRAAVLLVEYCFYWYLILLGKYVTFGKVYLHIFLKSMLWDKW